MLYRSSVGADKRFFLVIVDYGLSGGFSVACSSLTTYLLSVTNSTASLYIAVLILLIITTTPAVVITA